ncbi:C-type lectin domain and C-type lectin-like domain and C-type lectin fold domain-containing protein [Strongyloides ratti]|uniref:C-type lectin domain and C-type lectin-like domain and C-type lectin fold domain-containing protein n=1 Tax=Strongyloides ratti TaxID=34506 RepID=A0A090LEL4_STRRB|nr:C-type lectin domain and C-type lectin-like domain and C-type lectin fold domain-containing protein [Strongyloides ratti]CEF68186.1 C-type lectin domain and C-type lectin-like domain and C-type lectin fold domain-containing protein [Strongyloides ratti]
MYKNYLYFFNIIFFFVYCCYGSNTENKKICTNGYVPLRDNDKDSFDKCININYLFTKTWVSSFLSCSSSGGKIITFENKDDVLMVNKIIKRYNKVNYKTSTLFDNISKYGIWYGAGQTCPGMYNEESPILRYVNGSYLYFKDRKKIIDINIYEDSNDNSITNKENVCLVLYLSGTGLKNELNEPYFMLERCTKEKMTICVKDVEDIDKKHEENSLYTSSNDYYNSDYNEIFSMSKKYPCGLNIFWCPIKIKDEGIKCYGVVRQPVDWDHSRDICSTYLNGDLASFHSNIEESHVQAIIKEAEKVYNFMTTGFWIGLNRKNAEKSLEWSDDSPLNYLGRFASFNTIKEENEHNDGNCFIIKKISNTTKYGWHRMRCDSQNSFICEKPGYGYNTSIFQVNSKKFEHSFDNKGCNKGEKYYNGMCYILLGVNKEDKKNFHDADDDCRSRDMTLVSIVDEYEQNMVLSILHNLQEDVWIGMSVTKGSLKWLDQESVKYTKFSPINKIYRSSGGSFYFTNENSYGFHEDGCVSFDASNHEGFWNVIPLKHLNISFISKTNTNIEIRTKRDCSNTKLGYICERYATKDYDSKTENENSEQPLCHTMKDEDISFCYLKNNKKLSTKIKFKEASHLCGEILDLEPYQKLNNDEKKVGYLPVPENSFEWAYLTIHSDMNNYDSFWIGIQYSKEKGFVRHDGGRIKMGIWGPDEPNLHKGNCVITKLEDEGPRWYMTSCYDEHETICKIGYKKKKNTEIKVKCPAGKENWILGKTKCYYVEENSYKRFSLTDNNHKCYLHYNATLASFPTKEDFQIFTEFVHSNKNVNDRLYIGLIRLKYGKFAWIDGSPINFFNWDKNEPYKRDSWKLSHNLDTRCTVLLLSKGYAWASDFCKRDYNYVCSVDVVDINEIEPIPDSSEKDNQTTDNPDEKKLLEDDNKKNVKNDNKEEDKKEAKKTIENHKDNIKSIFLSFLILLILTLSVGGILYYLKLRQDNLKNQQILQTVNYSILENDS